MVGVKVDARVGIRVPSFLSAVLPESRSEAIRVREAKEDDGHEGDGQLDQQEAEGYLCGGHGLDRVSQKRKLVAIPRKKERHAAGALLFPCGRLIGGLLEEIEMRDW